MSDEPLLDIAAAISNRTPVDWEQTSAALTNDEDRAVLRELQALAALAALHKDAEAPAEPDGLIPGATTWGGLKLVEAIGEGAFGQVFRAWDPQLDREVALKILHRGAASSETIAEGRLLARVKHPNVLTVYSADEHDGQVALSMEYIRGRTLASLIETLGPFGARETAGIGIDLCRALAAVHGAGLLHRDIKAQNVMREHGGRIVLMDFGAGAGAPNSAGLVGTPLYLAPEVLQGGAATRGSDLYSLGVLLFHLLTGSYPVTASSVEALIDTHRSGAPQRLRDLRPDLPDGLVTVVERAIGVDAAGRYESAALFEEGLQRTQQDQPALSRAAGWIGRVPLGRAAAVLATVMALVLGAAYVPRFVDGSRAGHAPAFQSIAVLPIKNLTGDAGNEYLADGLTESLTSNLSRMSALHVTAYRSSMALKESAKTPTEIADALNVQMLLDGSIRRTTYNGRVLVTVNLVDPRSGRTIWSRSEEPELAGWQQVEHALFNLLEFEIAGKTTMPPPAHVDADAFEDYLRGRYQWNKRTKEGLLAARDLFARALERQPSFAAAHAGLADAYLMLGEFNWLPSGDALAKAEASARRAVALDDTLAAPHATLAYLLVTKGEWPAAEQAFERALTLDPNYATARQWYALSLRYHDFGAAVAQIERARDLDPLSEIIGTDVAVVYRTVGRHADAIEQLRRVVRVHPTFAEASHQLAELFEVEGRYQEGLAVLEAAVKVRPDDPRLLCGLSVAYARAGRMDAARAAYRTLRKEAETTYTLVAFLMMAAAAAGDVDEAIAYARQGVSQREPNTLRILTSREFPHDRLRALEGSPGFDQVVREAEAALKR